MTSGPGPHPLFCVNPEGDSAFPCPACGKELQAGDVVCTGCRGSGTGLKSSGRLESAVEAADEPTLMADSSDTPTAFVPRASFGPSPVIGDGSPPRRFGDYELIEEIARGGMGVVYRARQISLNRIVALKLILAGEFASKDFVRRFQTEAEAAAALDHPNIVPIYEIGQDGGQHYFSMRLIEGASLATRLRTGPMAAAQAVRLMIRLARAVQYAHGRGILHRDLKPANVLLDQSGNPWLTDFGLAKLLKSDGALTLTNAVLGTPAYMAPEQAGGGARRVTASVDVYAMGAILYETLAGRTPFAGDSTMEVLRQVLEVEPEPLFVHLPTADRDLNIICLKCLEKTPDRRYRTAEALAAELERWERGEPIQARAVGLSERTWKWVRRNRNVSVLTTIALVMLLALAWQSRRVWNSEAHAAEAAAERRAAVRQAYDLVAALQQAMMDARVAEQAAAKYKETSRDGAAIGTPEVATELKRLMDEQEKLARKVTEAADQLASMLALVQRQAEPMTPDSNPMSNQIVGFAPPPEGPVSTVIPAPSPPAAAADQRAAMLAQLERRTQSFTPGSEPITKGKPAVSTAVESPVSTVIPAPSPPAAAPTVRVVPPDERFIRGENLVQSALNQLRKLEAADSSRPGDR